MPRRLESAVLTDYQQSFLLGDELLGNRPENIAENCLRQRFKRTIYLLAVCTGHSATMPVVVTVDQLPPHADMATSDHTVRTWIDVLSGRLMLTGDSGYRPDHVTVLTGRSSIPVAGRPLSDAIREAYEIALWPSGKAQSAVLSSSDGTPRSAVQSLLGHLLTSRLDGTFG